jgi:hypothetical protein
MESKIRKSNKGEPNSMRFSNTIDNFLRIHCQEVTGKNKTNYVEDLIKQDLWKRGIEI